MKIKSAFVQSSRDSQLKTFWKETLFDPALDAAIGVDSQGEIFEWNQSAEILFGKLRHEVLGFELPTVIPDLKLPMIHSLYSSQISNLIELRIQHSRREITIYGKNGEPIPLEMTAIPLKRGKEFYFCLYLRNILTSKPYDEFIQVASHELRTPLTSLKLQNTLAKKAFERDQTLSFDRLRKLLEISERQLGRLNLLVEDMLDVSRMAMGHLNLKLERTELKSVILNVVKELEEPLKMSGCELQLQVSSEIHVNVDRTRMTQVIANLFNNAMKYGSGKPIEISLQEKNQLALLSIRDQGVGIPQESLDKIFQRFERAMSAENISGLGLGLYTVRQILNAHQGEISVASALGEGSLFTIALPTAEIN